MNKSLDFLDEVGEIKIAILLSIMINLVFNLKTWPNYLGKN